MKSTVGLCVGLIGFSSFFAFAACSDDDDAPTTGSGGQGNEGGAQAQGGTNASAGMPSHAGGAQGGAGHGEGAVICEVVGTLCHAADTGSGQGHDCHELGHEGNVEACEEQFASCIGFCVEGETGAGGAGGASSGQDPFCAALGELCHPIEDGLGPECHELGHEGNAANCAASFEECAHFCLEARETLEPAAGGAGGAPGAAGASAGGASQGGAGGAQ